MASWGVPVEGLLPADKPLLHFSTVEAAADFASVFHLGHKMAKLKSDRIQEWLLLFEQVTIGEGAIIKAIHRVNPVPLWVRAVKLIKAFIVTLLKIFVMALFSAILIIVLSGLYNDYCLKYNQEFADALEKWEEKWGGLKAGLGAVVRFPQ